MKREVKAFNLDLAKKCQSGEEKGYVYCSDGIDEHKLVSGIKEVGQGYYAAWFKGLNDEYMQVFRFDGYIHNSKWKVYIETYGKSELKPFDKVLVRETDHDTWKARLYDYYGGSWYFCQDGHGYNQCIRFEGHEYLAGTSLKPKPTNDH